MKVVLVIQARMGSTRLPGKVLKKIGEKSILEHLVERVRKSKLVTSVIVATTVNKEDDVLEKYCSENGILCHRGSDWDVLDRFYQTVKSCACDAVVRVTADCPLNTHAVVDFVIGEFVKSGGDYFSNSNHEPHVLEDGFDVEVFRFSALKKAWREAKLLSEREHVTPYIKNSGKFKCAWKKYSAEYNFKLSVDTLDDFAAVSQIFAELSNVSDFGMEEVIELLRRKPEILQLNKSSVANSGYKKSLNEDRHV